jgi:hypothetical protein
MKGEAETIKGARYPLSKNPEHLNGNQQVTLEMISKSNPKLFRGYLLKEKLRLVFQHPFAKAKEELEEWLAWAQRCRIPQFVELREKIKRHFEAILSSVKYTRINGRAYFDQAARCGANEPPKNPLGGGGRALNLTRRKFKQGKSASSSSTHSP